jgi:integrase/recombinase XerD
VINQIPLDPIECLVDDYLAHCRASGLAAKTVSGAYAFPLRQVFLPFCKAEGITEPSQLTNRVLDRLAAQLLETGGARGQLSKATTHSYLRPVNQMLKWAKEEGEIGDVKAHLPRLPKPLIDVLSRDEITKLEDTARNERDKLIVRVLADTGIRVGELVKLRVGDLVERERGQTFLRIRGKGDRERWVPAVPKLARRLQRYVRGRPHDVSSDRIFLGLKRRAGADELEPLTESGVQQLVRWLGRTAGLTQRVYPHLFRHSFATWALARGMNPIQLAQLLGHSSLVMIQNVYAHLSPGDGWKAVSDLLADD